LKRERGKKEKCPYEKNQDISLRKGSPQKRKGKKIFYRMREAFSVQSTERAERQRCPQKKKKETIKENKHFLKIERGYGGDAIEETKTKAARRRNNMTQKGKV